MLAVERMLPALKKYKEFHKPQSAFEFYSRARRNIALSTRSLTNAKGVYFPYLDKELFEFLSAVPIESYPANDFHTSIILKSYPDYANIPFRIKASKAPYSWFDKLSYKYMKCIGLCFFFINSELSNYFDRRRILTRLVGSLLFPVKAGTEEWVGPMLLHFEGLVSLLNKK